jgi:hypothetical protein
MTEEWAEQLFEQALAQPIGLVLEVDNLKSVYNAIFAARKKLGRPEFYELTIAIRESAPNTIFIRRKTEELE